MRAPTSNHRNHRRRGRRGVTLIEILTVVTLFLVLMTGIFAIHSTVLGEYARGSAKMAADDETSLALQKMSREIRNGLRAFVQSPTELRVRLPVLNAQGDYDRYTEGSLLRFYLSNGKLYRQEDAAVSTVLVSGVSALTFTTETTSSGLQYRVSLTCQQSSGNQSRQTTLNTTLCLRNEPAS
jgi:prepilin-type N-terminal cleavage/methylation domain-containing protein